MHIENFKKKKNEIINKNFFNPKWYSFIINPYFINRSPLYKEITKFSNKINHKENILDVGCGIKPYRNLFKNKDYVGIDIEGGGHPDSAKTIDKFYDGENIPYEDNSFGNIICTQVLEHAEKPETLIKEFSRILKKEGGIFISMPFIYPEHEIPHDFQRYTSFKHKKILEKNGFKNINIVKSTGFCGTFGQIFIIYFYERLNFKRYFYKLIISIIIVAPIQLLFIFLDFILRKSGPTMDYIITAQKI